MQLSLIDPCHSFRDEHTPAQMVRSAFLAAYLLTGSAEASQMSVEEAIQVWDPPSGRSGLLQHAASAALTRENEEVNDFSVPAMLRSVMNLPACMRRCFVLRCLLGLTRAATGKLLFLSNSQVDDYTCAAMMSLAADACK